MLISTLIHRFLKMQVFIRGRLSLQPCKTFMEREKSTSKKYFTLSSSQTPLVKDTRKEKYDICDLF